MKTIFYIAVHNVILIVAMKMFSTFTWLHIIYIFVRTVIFNADQRDSFLTIIKHMLGRPTTAQNVPRPAQKHLNLNTI